MLDEDLKIWVTTDCKFVDVIDNIQEAGLWDQLLVREENDKKQFLHHLEGVSQRQPVQELCRMSGHLQWRRALLL